MDKKTKILAHRPLDKAVQQMEDLAAGQPIWLNIMTGALPPHSMWTVNPDTNEGNF